MDFKGPQKTRPQTQPLVLEIPAFFRSIGPQVWGSNKLKTETRDHCYGLSSTSRSRGSGDAVHGVVNSRYRLEHVAF